MQIVKYDKNNYFLSYSRTIYSKNHLSLLHGIYRERLCFYCVDGGGSAREVKKGQRDHEFSVPSCRTEGMCKNFTLFQEKSKCYVISVAF